MLAPGPVYWKGERPVARLADTTGTDAVADRIRLRRGGELTSLDRMLLHSPAIADGWNNFLGAIRTRAVLAADLRELVILRVAALNDAAYEWNAHEPLARKAGLSETDIEAVRESAAPRLLSERREAVCAYADAMTSSVEVPDQVFAAIKNHLSVREIVELTATIAAYNLVSRFLVALEITTEDDPLPRPADERS